MVEQAKPDSDLQSDEQPSLERVLPSSHCSFVPGRITPSPHTAWQMPSRLQLGSRTHRGEHPSPMSLLPSSHCSVPSRTLSPQTVFVQGLLMVSHLYPDSRRQTSLQPSPALALPSSHSSS